MSTSSANLYNISGILLPKDACIVIVRTEWNADTIEKLENGCKKVLEENGIHFKKTILFMIITKERWENCLTKLKCPSKKIRYSVLTSKI